jgi:hypothetical protein
MDNSSQIFSTHTLVQKHQIQTHSSTKTSISNNTTPWTIHPPICMVPTHKISAIPLEDHQVSSTSLSHHQPTMEVTTTMVQHLQLDRWPSLDLVVATTQGVMRAAPLLHLLRRLELLQWSQYLFTLKKTVSSIDDGAKQGGRKLWREEENLRLVSA